MKVFFFSHSRTLYVFVAVLTIFKGAFVKGAFERERR